VSPWDQLDPEQRQAVHHLYGPAKVLAGPGSGKTRVVVLRAAWLLHQGIPPEEIALITFTRKAAHEMRSRLEDLVGDRAHGVWISTFHGLAYSILRKVLRFVLLDREDSEKLAREALQRAAEFGPRLRDPWAPPEKIVIGEREVKDFLARLSYIKNVRPDSPELRYDWIDAINPFRLYEATKEERGCLDFDDLVPKALASLEREPQLREEFAARFTFTMVDEFQDTSPVQARLLQALLPGDPPNLMLVGDPDQAIYSWRGATPSAFDELFQKYPDAAVYWLSTNYRSHEGLVSAARAFLRDTMGESRFLKAGRSGPPPCRVWVQNPEDETEFVAQAVWRHASEEGIPYKEMAVLVRTHWYTERLERVFARYGIPYVVLTQPFWRREEVAILLNLLAGAVGDAQAESQILHRLCALRRGRFLHHLWEEEVQEILAPLKEAALLRGKEAGRRVRQAEGEIWKLLRPVLQEVAVRRGEDLKRLRATLREVLAELYTWADQDPDFRLEDFVNSARLAMHEPQGWDQEGVRVMTVHAAKGLEFSVVFVVGVRRGLFPHYKADFGDHEAYADEVRLFYVAMTRAKEYLYLSKDSWDASVFLKSVPGRDLLYERDMGFVWPDVEDIFQGLGGGKRGAG